MVFPGLFGYLGVDVSVISVLLIRPSSAFVSPHGSLLSTRRHAAVGIPRCCGSFVDERQELGRLDDLICRYLANAQKCGNPVAVQEGECFVWRFAVKGLTLNCIDMRENQIDRALRKVVKRPALWYNVPEDGVVFLHLRLLG